MKTFFKAVLLFLLVFPTVVNAQTNSIRPVAKPVVSILGDSYSTFEGYMPKGNAVWYTRHTKADRTDVGDVKQTWWWQLIDKGGFILGKNDSYSGATISYRGYNGDDYSDRSFITRVGDLGSPDILLIFGGTNDSWAGVEVGEYNYSNYILGEDLYKFRPAMSRLLSDAINHYPGTTIFFIINSDLRQDITESMKEICRHYSVPFIELHDIPKTAGHPSKAGMKAIALQVFEGLLRNRKP
ncbi:MAG: hypothetical protein HDR88_08275 [Bacteroides sp.]|nr:hypothetical protein [Bacteroides sp.]